MVDAKSDRAQILVAPHFWGQLQVLVESSYDYLEQVIPALNCYSISLHVRYRSSTNF